MIKNHTFRMVQGRGRDKKGLLIAIKNIKVWLPLIFWMNLILGTSYIFMCNNHNEVKGVLLTFHVNIRVFNDVFILQRGSIE